MDYIGAKLVKAEPQEGNGRPGYCVRYPDGYISWCPKDVFEAAYLPLDADKPAPSVSPAVVDGFIERMEFSTIGEKTTLCRAVLVNGFELIESSSCVSRENYDQTIGAAICEKKIRDKVWVLLGFLLQTATMGVKGG